MIVVEPESTYDVSFKTVEKVRDKMVRSCKVTKQSFCMYKRRGQQYKMCFILFHIYFYYVRIERIQINDELLIKSSTYYILWI